MHSLVKLKCSILRSIYYLHTCIFLGELFEDRFYLDLKVLDFEGWLKTTITT